MTASMLEKVARAIDPEAWPAPADLGYEDMNRTLRRIASIRSARAALEAMREPPEAVLLGIKAAFLDATDGSPMEILRAIIAAMIDAALCAKDTLSHD